MVKSSELPNQVEPSFAEVFFRLSEPVRKRQEAFLGLDSTFQTTSKIARKADEVNGESQVENRSRLFLLSEAIFGIWFYQYDLIIKVLLGEERRKGVLPERSTDIVNIFSRHKSLGECIVSDLNVLVAREDKEKFTQRILEFWEKYISELMEFINMLMEFVKVLSVQDSQKPLPSRFRPSSISPQTSYAIFTTILFLLGIIIATFILIKG